MTHTFDIRFARSAGLAAFLEAPENRFHWKGGGLLRIDAQSISFTVQRSLLALFRMNRTQRISAENLREVYREGEALRLEYQTENTARVVLPFWASDRDTAEQIVRLLPTRHTVEIEHSTGATHSGKPRADWRAMLAIAVSLAAAIVGASVLYSRTPESPRENPAPSATLSAMPSDRTTAMENALPASGTTANVSVESTGTATPTLDASGPETPLPSFLEPPPIVLPPLPPLPLPSDYVRSEDFVIPIARGTPAYDVARRQLTVFEREAAVLESEFRTGRLLLASGALTPEDFAARLDDLEMRWWEVTFRVFDSDELARPALLDLRAAMLGAARRWRGFLSMYAAGLRKRDHVMMAHSFDELARAQEMQSRARLFLR